MTPTRKRRLIAVGLVLLAVGIAAALTVMALSQNMTYLFSPSEALAGGGPGRPTFFFVRRRHPRHIGIRAGRAGVRP